MSSEALAFPQPFGRYQLIERMAVGGMAEIFRARVVGAHGFQKTVVIKRILPHLASDPSFVGMFIDEAKLTARLEHPKIIQVIDFGEVDGQLFIAMEMVDGLDALGVLRSCTHKKIRLPFALSVHIVHEVLDALDYAHKAMDDDGVPLGIVHRDISPSNVLIARRGDVKLGDFGIARAAERQGKTKAGTLKGKYGYMSPEQVVGGELDGRSDLFSAGIVLAEMLMGRRLFTAPNELDVLLMVRDVKLDRLAKFGADIPGDLRLILAKAFERDRDQRYASAAAMRDDLAEWLFSNRQRVTAADLSSFIAQVADDLPVPGAETPAPVRPPTSAVPPPATVTQSSGGTLKKAVRNLPPKADETPVRESGKIPKAAPAPGAVLPGRSGPPPMRPSQLAPPGQARQTGWAARAERPPPAASFVDRLPAGLEDGDLPMLTPTPSGSLDIQLDDAVPVPVDMMIDLPSGPIDLPRLPSDEPPADAPYMPLPEPQRPGPNAKPGPEPAAPAMQLPEQAPNEQGELHETSPIRLLARRAVAQQTGLLVMDWGGIAKQIFLVRGSPEFVASNVARELFGEYLKQHNIISSSELSMALAMMPHFGGKLGDTLVGLGLLRPLEVFRHLTRQVREKLIDVCTWQRGTYRWYDSYVNPKESFPLGLDAFEVLGAGSTALDAAICTTWAQERASRRPTVVTGRPRIAPEQFRLGPAPRDLLQKLGGRKTVRELVQNYDREDDRQAFLRTLILLVETELVNLL